MSNKNPADLYIPPFLVTPRIQFEINKSIVPSYKSANKMKSGARTKEHKN